MDYIDGSGTIYLTREAAPEQSRWREFRYDATMSFVRLNEGNLVPMVSAVYQGRLIPLYYGSISSGGSFSRLTELHSGHGFQIREAGLLKESNEIITFSTANRDGPGWGKLNGELSLPFKEYFIIKYSLDTGRTSGYWDFFERRWTSEFPDTIGVYFPDNGNWDNFPSTTTVRKDAYITWWNNAVTDFPHFLDIQKGLKRGVSMDSLANTNEGDDLGGQRLSYPKQFQAGFVDEITNFNPEVDKLAIDQRDYAITGSISLKVVKSKSPKAASKAISKFARKEFDFIYDFSTGLLYFNENGREKGFGEGGVCALFNNTPLLNADNFELT